MRVTLFAAFIALIATTTSTSAAVIYSTEFDAWTISAYSSDSTGQPSHCVASVSYTNGNMLLFGLTKDFRWSMAIGNEAWNLPSGGSYPITYRIDRGRVIRANAEVLNRSFVVVQLVDSSALFQSFRRGQVLAIIAAGRSFSFGLKSSSKALASTMACVQDLNSSGNSNPFVTTGTTRQHGRSVAKADAYLKTEATTLAANMLSSAGITDFELIDKFPPNSSYHAAFTAPDLFGTVLILAASTVDDAVELTASDAKKCKGEFATMKLPHSSSGVSLKMACVTSGKPETWTYVILPRPKGGIYLIRLSDLGDGAPSDQPGIQSSTEATAGKLMDASLKVLSRP